MAYAKRRKATTTKRKAPARGYTRKPAARRTAARSGGGRVQTVRIVLVNENPGAAARPEIVGAAIAKRSKF